MAISKVVYGGKTLIDLTQDTVESDKLLRGFKAHGADGEPVEGTCDFDVDSSGATAVAAEVLSGKTFAKGGSMHTGSMKNNGAVSGKISTKDGKYTVPQGYHDDSGSVEIESTERAKIVPANIREGVTILGVVGEMSGSEDETPQDKTVTPTTEDQIIVPDSGFTCLRQVTVKAIPYVESDNAAGGKTVTIG